eukprot:31394-Pelagococcus_subviridis.AAC.5
MRSADIFRSAVTWHSLNPGRVLTFRKRARWPRGEDERLRARARGADRGEQATDARDGDHDVIREARARDGDAGADAGARDDPHFDPTLAGGNIPSTLFCLVASSRGFARRIAIASVAEPRYLLVRAHRASSRRRKPSKPKAFVPVAERRRSTRERATVDYAAQVNALNAFDSDSDSDDVGPRKRARRAPAEKRVRKKILFSSADAASSAARRYAVGGRVYDSELGVTCHWCRQKTVEPHVHCSNESCRRGNPIAFCGRCLRNRHGEDVEARRASLSRSPRPSQSSPLKHRHVTRSSPGSGSARSAEALAATARSIHWSSYDRVRVVNADP